MDLHDPSSENSVCHTLIFKFLKQGKSIPLTKVLTLNLTNQPKPLSTSVWRKAIASATLVHGGRCTQNAN